VGVEGGRLSFNRKDQLAPVAGLFGRLGGRRLGGLGRRGTRPEPKAQGRSRTPGQKLPSGMTPSEKGCQPT